MARSSSPGSRLLAVAMAVFVVAVAASLLKRCHAPLDAGIVPDTKHPGTLIGQPEQVGTGSQSNIPTAAGAISGTSEAKPAVKGRSIQVSDIFGANVRGARIRNTRIDGSSGRDLITSEDGRAEVPEDAWEDSFLYCGDMSVPLKNLERGVPYQFPGPSASVFGELAILPLGWEELRVSLEGQNAWKHAVATDDRWGHRLLYLRPGTYELTTVSGRVLGKATVMEGQRTTYTVSGFCGFKINISFAVEPEPLPTTVWVMYLPVGSPQDHRIGIGMKVRNGQRTYTILGLAPGYYQIFVDNDEFEFRDHVYLADGQVPSIEVKLKAKP